VNADRLEEFVQGQITGDLTEVPGIGPAAVKLLSQHENQHLRITNTYQLIGQYLMLKGPEDGGEKVDCYAHNDKFWYWLKSRGISSHRSGVVQAIARKCNSFMTGLYDPTIYESDDEEEEQE
jgi:hypothetical protein